MKFIYVTEIFSARWNATEMRKFSIQCEKCSAHHIDIENYGKRHCLLFRRPPEVWEMFAETSSCLLPSDACSGQRNTKKKIPRNIIENPWWSLFNLGRAEIMDRTASVRYHRGIISSPSAVHKMNLNELSESSQRRLDKGSTIRYERPINFAHSTVSWACLKPNVSTSPLSTFSYTRDICSCTWYIACSLLLKM